MVAPILSLTTVVREYRRIFSPTTTPRFVHYPEDGDYLIDGQPSRRFDALKQKLGNSLTLLSGYRGHPKQMLLYLDKVVASDGNLSLASRNVRPVIPTTFQAISILGIGAWGREFLSTIP